VITGAAASNAACSPPHITVSTPFSAPDWPPETRGVDEAEAAACRLGVKLARDVRRGRGVIDEDRAGAHAGECTVRSEHHASEIVVVADAGAHHVAARSRFTRRRHRLAAVLGDPLPGLGGRAVVDFHLVAGTGQMPGHRVAHHPQANESNLHRCPRCR